MRSVLGMSTVLLTLAPLSYYPTSTGHYRTEAWWTCYSSPPHTWRRRSDVILATGQSLSVILPTVRHLLDPVITPAQGWKGIRPTWLDVPCHVGRVTVWLPIQETPGQSRPFSLLALLPQQDVPDAPPFIQLGVQFLLEYRIQVVLNEGGTAGNRLIIP